MLSQLLNKASKLVKSAGLKLAVETVEKGPVYERPLSATVGRLSSVPTAVVLGTTAPLGHSASGEEAFADPLINAAARDVDVDKELPLRVSYGDIHPIDSLQRTWKNPRTSILTKLLGTAGLPYSSLQVSLGRSDHYNPFSHEVVIYNPDPAIMAHELGHAKHFAHTKYPGLMTLFRNIPGLSLYQEGVASENAMELLRKAKMTDEIERANRVLGGGFGSYVGSTIPVAGPATPILGGLAGQAVGYAAQPFSGTKTKTKKGSMKVVYELLEKAAKKLSKHTG